jgi:hypothetical protein
MKTIRGLAAGACLFLSFACGMGNSAAPSGGWVALKEQTTCEALAAAYCVGAFGFTVQNDGRFTVGPADSGSTLTGTLSESERARISSDAALVGADLTGSPQCEAGTTVPGTSDEVDLVDARIGPVRVFDRGGTVGSTCYRGGRDHALQLHSDLSALMARYYPRPFPG